MEKTVDERREEIDNLLNSYEANLGLNPYKEEFYSDEVQKYFTMDRNELSRLEPEDCAIASVELSQLAFHIQRSYNLELSRFNWADSLIQQVICKEVSQYRGSYTQNEQQAILNNSYALKLSHIKRYCKQRMDRLTFVSTSIKNLSDKLEKLQMSKFTRKD